MIGWKNRALTALFVVTLALPASGCALLLIGAAGAAGGYAISKDELEGLIDTSFDKAWLASRQVLQKEGAITMEDKNTGAYEAIVENSTINITVEQATPKTVKLRVKARKTKGLFPDIKTAQKIYTKIIKKLG